MASLDEQLALFEKEVLSAVASAGTKQEVKAEDRPIQENEVGGSTSSTAPTLTKFVPHQLQQKPHPVQTNRYPPATAAAPSSVIESGPTLYAPPTNEKTSSKSAAKEKSEPPGPSGSILSQMHQQQFKTLALPSDVELLMAKKQATKAYENSYLGAVLRGEKKMKRFVRSCGGQTWEDASMAEWDPNDFRIFCGDLGNEVSDELLAKAFRKFPSFQKAKVVRDSRTNKSKGYGFVSFRNQEDFIRAMKEMDGKYVGNRPIKLRKSNWKDRNADVVKKKNKEKKKLGLV